MKPRAGAAYRILSAYSCKVADVKGGESTPPAGAEVIQFAWNRGLNQLWRFDEEGESYRLRPLHAPDHCMATRRGRVVLAAATDDDHQRWKVTPAGDASVSLANAATGLALQLPDPPTHRDDQLAVSGFVEATQARWVLLESPDDLAEDG